MKQWLATAGLIVALVQSAAELVKSFEVSGFGAEKKTVVLEMIGKTFEFIRGKFGVDVAWDDIKGLVDSAINAIVNFFNVVGIFKK